MRAVGVDWGQARIGIAVGDSDHMIFSARTARNASGSLKKDAEMIVKLAQLEEAEIVILGIPEHENDTRGKGIVLKLADHISGMGVKTGTVDESFTTVEVHSEMRELGLKASQRRKAADGASAVKILERYFSQ